MRRQLLDKDKHPAWQYMDGEYFAAWRDDQLLGTIVAIINHEHNRYHDENIGFFGMFETVNEVEVSAGLLNAAGEWVRARGADAIRGPANFTTNDECGLLVDNFAQPVIMMPYNPAYYRELVEAAGFEKAMDIHCLYMDRSLIEAKDTLARLERLVGRAAKRSNIAVRKFDARDNQAEFRRFQDIYNAAWDKNWGFIPMNEAELKALVDDLGMLVEPDLACFAEISGEPVGFALSIPNFNEALHRAYPRPGVPEWFTMAQVAWHWKIRRSIKGVRMPLMGVRQEFRNKGVELAMMLELMKALLPLSVPLYGFRLDPGNQSTCRHQSQPGQRDLQDAPVLSKDAERLATAKLIENLIGHVCCAGFAIQDPDQRFLHNTRCRAALAFGQRQYALN